MRIPSIGVVVFTLILAAEVRAEQAQSTEPEEAGSESEESPTVRAGEWQLQCLLGGEFFVFLNQVAGNGPSFRFSALRLGWRGNFMIGGGLSLFYSFLIEPDEPRDKIHQMTLNGEFLIGGGIYRRFAVYFHLIAGGGGAHVYDGETRTEGWLPWGRAAAGVGGWVNINSLISLGALVDVGYPGVIDAYVTVDFHFPH